MLMHYLSVIIRRWKLASLLFLGMELGIVIYTASLPNVYTSTIKLMLNRGRVDSVVSTDEGVKPRQPASVTVEELNTELQLLQSRDLLRKVVVAHGLHEAKKEPGVWDNFASRLGLPEESESTDGSGDEVRIARAAARLSTRLTVVPVRQSNLIEISYSAPNPASAARVLNTLAELYLEKHTEVHRPPGTFAFYQREAEHSQKQLQELEDQMAALAARPEGAAPQLMKEELLRTGSEFEANLKKTLAEIAVTKERIATLERYASAAPTRGVAEVRTSSRIPDQLQTKLLELEIKRSGLLKIFQPTNTRVQAVESQIEQTRAAIEEYKQDTAVDKVTQRDPTHEWAQSELMKENANLAGLKAQVEAMQRTIAEYSGRIRQVSRLEITDQDLKRRADLAEKHYMLYLRKQEDARISDELDRHRIVNVVIVESASAPYAPSGPPKRLYVLLGTLFASGLSLGSMFFIDWIEPWLQAAAKKPIVRQLLRAAS